MIRARIKGSPLKMCYCSWFKNFIEHLESSEVAAWTRPNGGHRGVALLEHFHSYLRCGAATVEKTVASNNQGGSGNTTSRSYAS
jgi:hypothetical protein